MAVTGGGNSVLVYSAIGLLAGLMLVAAGRAIVDAINTGTYSTVIGIEVINSLVLWIGVAICVVSLLGIIFGVWRFVWYK